MVAKVFCNIAEIHFEYHFSRWNVLIEVDQYVIHSPLLVSSHELSSVQENNELNKLVNSIRGIFKERTQTTFPAREISWLLNIPTLRVLEAVNRVENEDLVAAVF